MKFLDAHVLYGRDLWLSLNKPELAHQFDHGFLCSAMDEAARSPDWRAAIMPFPSASEPSYEQENVCVLEAAAADDRLLPVVVANPYDPRNRDLLEEWADRQQIAGLMVWPILCKLDLRAFAELDSFWQFAELHDLPVTIHIATGLEPTYRSAVLPNAYRPIDAVTIARRWPGVRFNLSHALRLSRPALEQIADLDNVWTDLSGYSSYGRWLEGGQETFPGESPVIGADAPVELTRALVERYNLANRVMFASSEPFCRWWGSSAKSEFETHRAIQAELPGPLDSIAAATTFYRNWFDPMKPES